MNQETISKYDVKLPYKAYDLFILEAEKKVAQNEKKTPYHALKVEIRNEAPLEVEGQAVDVNGLFIYYNVYTGPKSFKHFNKFRRACRIEELNNETELLTDDPKLYVGKMFKGLVICKPGEPKKDKDTGAAVLDPFTNQPVLNSPRREVEEVFVPPVGM